MKKIELRLMQFLFFIIACSAMSDVSGKLADLAIAKLESDEVKAHPEAATWAAKHDAKTCFILRAEKLKKMNAAMDEFDSLTAQGNHAAAAQALSVATKLAYLVDEMGVACSR